MCPNFKMPIVNSVTQSHNYRTYLKFSICTIHKSEWLKSNIVYSFIQYYKFIIHILKMRHIHDDIFITTRQNQGSFINTFGIFLQARDAISPSLINFNGFGKSVDLLSSFNAMSMCLLFKLVKLCTVAHRLHLDLTTELNITICELID